MTVAAGFLCKDGIIVAADTQESYGYPGALKSEVLKIDHSQQSTWSIAIAGAGDSGYVQMCAQKILNSTAITENSPCPSVHTVESIAMEIFRNYMLPLSAYPTADRPTAHMVIATQPKNGSGSVVEWNGTSFVSQFPFVFVGAGGQMGSHLAKKFGHSLWGNPVNKSAGLVIYIMDQVKAMVEGCGGDTNVIILRQDGQVRRIYPGQVKSLEEQYRRLDFGSVNSLADKILENMPDLESF